MLLHHQARRRRYGDSEEHQSLRGSPACQPHAPGCAHGLSQPLTAFKAPSCRRSNFPTDVQCSPSHLPLQSHPHQFWDMPEPSCYHPRAPQPPHQKEREFYRAVARGAQGGYPRQWQCTETWGRATFSPGNQQPGQRLLKARTPK